MPLLSHVRLMAAYNAWMNGRLYEAARQLPAEALLRDRKAFFGSILGTLNHLVVADTIWLKRFASHPADHEALDPLCTLSLPDTLDQVIFTDFAELAAHRQRLDSIIERWADTLTEQDLQHGLHYVDTSGRRWQRNFFSLAMHFFNHQTHHRGQATALLNQAGVDMGVTDLLELIPEQPA